RLCTAGELQALAPELADVASQHESVALTDPATHLGYLDRFAQLTSARAELGKDVGRLEHAVAALREARELERGRGEREAFVRFQLQTTDAPAPRAGEIDELAAERSRLRNADRLHDVTERAASRLEEGDDAVCDTIGRLAAELRAAAATDGALD